MIRARPKPTWRGADALYVVRKLGLASGLQMCLDAGAAASYDPGVQTDKWLDLSPQGYDFFRGSGTGADGGDPTFAGTAGRRSSAERWTSDGSRFLTLDQANPTSVENVHKDNALFTMLAWFYTAGGTGGTVIAGTTGSGTTGPGFNFQRNGGAFSATCQLTILDASGTERNSGAQGTVVSNAWNFAGFSFDEANSAGVRCVNNSLGTFDASYPSPSSSAAAYTMQIGARGNGVNPLASTEEIAVFLFLSGVAWNAAQFQAFRNAMRGRFSV